jgi:hypothetical protein
LVTTLAKNGNSCFENAGMLLKCKQQYVVQSKSHIKCSLRVIRERNRLLKIYCILHSQIMTGGQKNHSRMRECLAADFFYIIVCKLYFPWLMNADAF